MMDVNDLIKTVFSNPKGEELLTELINQYCLTPVQPDTPPNELYFKEGQRDMVLFFVNILRIEDK